MNENSKIDSALQLKKYVRNQQLSNTAEIQSYLENSEIIAKILAEPYRTDTFTGLRKLEFLLVELSEIPYFDHLDQVQSMLETLYTSTNFEEGFSLTGKQAGVLACHNAICTLIFLRAGKKSGQSKGLNGLLSFCHSLKTSLRVGMERIFFIVLAVVLGMALVTMD